MKANIQLGIVGGGQLGKMFIQEAVNYDLQISVLDPDAQAPCRSLAHTFTVGSLTDFETVYNFGRGLDVLTIEIEAVNTEALEALEKEGVKVYPQPHIVRLIQDKRTQKQFYQLHQIPTADFILTDSQADLHANAHRLPAVLKLGKGGYDGKGVMLLPHAEAIASAFDCPCVLEDAVDIDKELAVIVARSANGEISSFPVTEMVFHPQYNLVDYLISPAAVTAAQEQQAQALARMVIEKLQMVGVLAVEMFLTKKGDILVNEIAPRPHNSGHHTIEGNYISQFSQHLRAIMGWPLGNTQTRCAAAMLNLIGEQGHTGKVVYKGLTDVIALPNVYVHLYGKAITKPSRKMGHVTLLAEDRATLAQRIEQVKTLLKVEAADD